MKEIKGIGFNIPSEDEDFIKLDSLSSLSEADIAILSPSFENTSYSTYTSSFTSDGTYNGKPCYNHDSSNKIKEHSSHWKKEIVSYLKTGKTLFVSLVEKKTFYIQTGRQEFSGTGRNRQTTNIVAEFSNYDFLPQVDSLKFQVAHGNTVLSQDSLFKSILNDFKKFISYQTYIVTTSEFRVGMTTKNKDKILGGVVSAFGGHIVFLPRIEFDTKEFTKYEKEAAYWTEDAIICGKKFIKSIIEIDKILREGSDKSPKPDWIEHEQFMLKASSSIKKKIENNNLKIQEINANNEILFDQLVKAEVLNDLLFETGKPLENAVIHALKILDFQAENFDDGTLELDQVILSPEGIRYIGECEGKENKAIDITKFRQLSDALNEDFEREEINTKAFGLLFGNPYRLQEPSTRGESFTPKCVSGAAREKIGLIETVQLYKVAKYLSENKNEKFKKKCREAIFEGLGNVIKFPDL